MKRHLRIAIEAGEHTCRATSDSPWCPMLRYGHGPNGYCEAFGKHLPYVHFDGTPASDYRAWLGRLPECKAAEFDAREGAE